MDFNLGKEAFGMKMKVRILTRDNGFFFQIKDKTGILRNILSTSVK